MNPDVCSRDERSGLRNFLLKYPMKNMTVYVQGNKEG